jgi:hypothetical protein
MIPPSLRQNFQLPMYLLFTYMGLDVWIWMGGNPFLRGKRGWALKSRLFWARMALGTLGAISGPKEVSISGPTPSDAPRYGLLPHPNPYVPPHVNKRYINSYCAAAENLTLLQYYLA